MTTINKTDIKVDIGRGPLGSCGFRNGMWPCSYHGREFEIFDSVPHVGEGAQRDHVRNSAAQWLAKNPE